MTSDGHFHTRTFIETDVVLAFEHKPNQPEKHPFERIHDFYLHAVEGSEAISSLFEYVVTLEGPAEALPSRSVIGELMHGRAYIAWGPHAENADAVMPTWGALRHFAVDSTYASATGDIWVRLKLTLRPAIWDLSQVVRTGIFHGLSSIDILKALLKDHEPPLQGLDSSGIRRPPSSREYTVQYQESDLDFVSRLLEHDGIFYYFTHGEGGDALVLGDANSAFLGAEKSQRRVLRSDLDGQADRSGDSVATIAWRDSTAPGRVSVRDYDYRQSAAAMEGETKHENPHALGSHAHFGEHFRSAADGKRIAAARLDALWSSRFELEATSYVRMLRAGERVQLDAHRAGPDFDNTEWLVTRVRHSIRQAGSAAAASNPARTAAGVVALAGYENTFVAVPVTDKLTFRPPLRTPRPKIFGLMTATVASDGDDAAKDHRDAPIDAEGRYRVNFPWPTHGAAVAGPSRWVRRAQMANGANFGTHYPVHAGVEVVISHLDGDPDRPIIVGSVPNSDTQSPVTKANNTQSIFRTKAGVTIITEDYTD